ncbi:Uma2 family endonuclease [Saccharothrix syringae]|uniref:Uma2 family endonuclease n=2 Tax=Saccharothrix syringae TaxID=103733 RepID=A0A5Q0GRL3_SACSY|nr:Uma2 family endonuclease [Saccharothrix syringae]QFZ16726.1 Uma2 family endonuclease [Saccharothrix syringae]
MTTLPGWMHPPREEGWLAEDLDHLHEAPRHTELIHGGLVFMLVPRRSGYSRAVHRLTCALEEQAPEGVVVEQEITIRLDAHNRPEPDIVVTAVPLDKDRTWHAPDDVLLVIEVVSPESAYRDRTVKPRKYAEAGIRHHWRVEEEDGEPVVHVCELDESTGAYRPVDVVRGTLHLQVPFEIKIDLPGLV